MWWSIAHTRRRRVCVSERERREERNKLHRHSFTAVVRKADWSCFLLFSPPSLLPSLLLPPSNSAVWVRRGQMSCYVRGKAAVRKVKLYFSVKGVFFSCQQAWLHQPLLDSPAQSPSFSVHFSELFLSLPPFLCCALPAFYLELHRVQIEGIICLRLSFSAMRWYWRSHSAPVSKINQKHFSTAAINAGAPFPSLLHIGRHEHTLKTQIHTHSLSLFSVFTWGSASLLNADIRYPPSSSPLLWEGFASYLHLIADLIEQTVLYPGWKWWGGRPERWS